MQARMKIRHRAARFGPHLLEAGEVIATQGDEGTPVSPKEMAHHLDVGNAEPLAAQPEMAVSPSGETAAVPKKAARPRPRSRGRRKPK